MRLIRSTQTVGFARSTGAFTLVEILVAMAVLLLVIVGVSQIVSGTAAVTNLNTRRIDTDDQVRIVLDRMGQDFNGMLRRKDVSYIFSKNKISENETGNDTLYFFSETTSIFGGSNNAQKSNVALVGYRVWDDSVNDPADHYYRLQRFSRGLDWIGNFNDTASGSNGNGSPVFLTFLPGKSTPETTIATAWKNAVCGPTNSNTYEQGATEGDFHTIADGIYRLEFCFLLKSGSYSGVPTTLTSGTPLPNANYATDKLVYGFPDDLAAIVVSVAAVDTRNLLALPRSQLTTELKTAAAALPDFDETSAHPQPVGAIWQSLVNSGKAGFSRSNLNNSVRIYQRWFYLSTP